MKTPDERIAELVKAKIPLTTATLENAQKHFAILKSLAHNLYQQIENSLGQKEEHAKIKFEEGRPNQCEIRLGDDTIWFHLQPNIFKIIDGHPLYKSSYIKENELRAHCAVINVYNFLTDTLIRKRNDDVGFLVTRIFINSESHFMVEGKKHFGLLFNDFSNDVLDNEKLEKIIKQIVLFCLEHDMVIPPFEAVQTITFEEISQNNCSAFSSEGKKLGFRFKSEDQPQA